MLSKILPAEIFFLFSKYVNIDNLNEIRLRLNYPIILNIKNKIFSLNQNGLCVVDEGLLTSKEIIEKIIYLSTENSMYAKNNQITSGFITAPSGIRIGIGGEFVYLNNKVSNINNINFLNIRIPHEILGCAKNVMPFIFDGNNFNNTLIISAPGVGKTTLLRDIVREVSHLSQYLNCLVVDERYEISGKNSLKNNFDLGISADVLYGCKKDFGFSCGIRSMSPNVIFTDELATNEDINGVLYASNCGVKIVATTHALNIKELLSKMEFVELLNKKIFSRIIVLSRRNGNGTIEGIYNEDFKLLYRE